MRGRGTERPTAEREGTRVRSYKKLGLGKRKVQKNFWHALVAMAIGLPILQATDHITVCLDAPIFDTYSPSLELSRLRRELACMLAWCLAPKQHAYTLHLSSVCERSQACLSSRCGASEASLSEEGEVLMEAEG